MSDSDAGRPRPISRRTFLTVAAVAVPVTALAIAVPTVLDRPGDPLLRWTMPRLEGAVARLTLEIHIPATVAASQGVTIFLDGTGSASSSVTVVSVDGAWTPFFPSTTPVQLFSAARSTAARAGSLTVAVTALDGGEGPGAVRATCRSADGTLLAEAVSATA